VRANCKFLKIAVKKVLKHKSVQHVINLAGGTEKEGILGDISSVAWVQISFRKWLRAWTTGLESGFEVPMTG